MIFFNYSGLFDRVINDKQSPLVQEMGACQQGIKPCSEAIWTKLPDANEAIGSKIYADMTPIYFLK